MIEIDLKSLKKFFSRIEVKGVCWEWKAAKSHGYGSSWLNGKQIRAHRISYELFKGEIPKGYEIDHLCRNKTCVNPDHLEAVTHRENLNRSPCTIYTINSKKTHCPKGHELTGNNLLKLNPPNRRNCRICYNRYKKSWRRRGQIR